MIYVTPGFEKGIGLEVYLKAVLELPLNQLNNFHLFAKSLQLEEVINLSKLDIKLTSAGLAINDKILKTTFLTDTDIPQTTQGLEEAFKKVTPSDILLTLPTKKDQLILNGKVKAGYTEYFREKYQQANLTMNFISQTDNVMLLTDHIPISKVESMITKDLVIKKVETTLTSFPKSRELKEIFFSGINPHCGEDGLMGSADSVLLESIDYLAKTYPNYKFHKPKAGDTLYFNHKDNSQLFVFAFHDQGLAPFKLKNGLIGINLTLGLPFKRVSVDHGTAPDIFGKDCADYRGMSYLLGEIQNW